MNQIGRRIFYDLTTGNVLCDVGERQGDVIPTTPDSNFATFPQLAGRTLADTGYIDAAYEDPAYLGGNYGSLHVDPATKAVTVYPKATETVSKTTILADGTDTATITITYPDTTDANLTQFSVNGGNPVSVNPVNGVCTFNFTASVAGTYTIVATTPKYGTFSNTITAG